MRELDNKISDIQGLYQMSNSLSLTDHFPRWFDYSDVYKICFRGWLVGIMIVWLGNIDEVSLLTLQELAQLSIFRYLVSTLANDLLM